MVTFVGIRSPPWSLQAPPRRRIVLCPSLVSLRFFFFNCHKVQCLFEVRSVPDWHRIGTYLVRTKTQLLLQSSISRGVKWWVWSSSVTSSIWRQGSSVRPISIIRLRNCSSRTNRSWILWKNFLHLLELVGGVVFFVSWFLLVTVPVWSPFLCRAVRNRKVVHRVLDEFLILLSSFSQEVRACTADDANAPVW